MSLMDRLTCFTCTSTDVGNGNAVLLLCDCLIALCQNCALDQLPQNNLIYKSHITCPKCKVTVGYEQHNIINNVDNALEIEEKLIRRALAHTDVSYSGKDTIWNFFKLQSCWKKLNECFKPSVQIMESPEPTKKDGSYDRAVVRLRYDIATLAHKSFTDLKVDHPLQLISFKKNKVLERYLDLLTDPKADRNDAKLKDCNTCLQGISSGCSVQLACECNQNLCRNCALFSTAYQKDTYSVGICCAQCKRTARGLLNNIAYTQDCEDALVNSAQRYLTKALVIIPALDANPDMVRARYIRVLKLYACLGYLGNIKIAEEEKFCRSSLQQLRLEIARLEEMRLNKVRLLNTYRIGAAPGTAVVAQEYGSFSIGFLHALQVKKNVFFEHCFLKQTAAQVAQPSAELVEIGQKTAQIVSDLQKLSRNTDRLTALDKIVTVAMYVDYFTPNASSSSPCEKELKLYPARDILGLVETYLQNPVLQYEGIFGAQIKEVLLSLRNRLTPSEATTIMHKLAALGFVFTVKADQETVYAIVQSAVDFTDFETGLVNSLNSEFYTGIASTTTTTPPQQQPAATTGASSGAGVRAGGAGGGSGGEGSARGSSSSSGSKNASFSPSSSSSVFSASAAAASASTVGNSAASSLPQRTPALKPAKQQHRKQEVFSVDSSSGGGGSSDEDSNYEDSHQREMKRKKLHVTASQTTSSYVSSNPTSQAAAPQTATPAPAPKAASSGAAATSSSNSESVLQGMSEEKRKLLRDLREQIRTKKEKLGIPASTTADAFSSSTSAAVGNTGVKRKVSELSQAAPAAVRSAGAVVVDLVRSVSNSSSGAGAGAGDIRGGPHANAKRIRGKQHLDNSTASTAKAVTTTAIATTSTASTATPSSATAATTAGKVAASAVAALSPVVSAASTARAAAAGGSSKSKTTVSPSSPAAGAMDCDSVVFGTSSVVTPAASSSAHPDLKLRVNTCVDAVEAVVIKSIRAAAAVQRENDQLKAELVLLKEQQAQQVQRDAEQARQTSALQTEVAYLKTQLSASDEKLADLTASWQESSTALEIATADRKREFDLQQTQLSQLQARYTTLQSAKGTLEYTSKAETDKLTNQLEQAKDNYKRARSDADKLRSRVQDLEITAQELRSTNESLLAREATLAAQEKKMQEEKVAYDTVQYTLASTFRDMEKLKTDKNREVEKLKAEKADLAVETSNLKRQIDMMAAEMRQLKRERNVEMDDYRSLQLELQETKEELADIKCKKKQDEEDLNRLMSELP